MANKKTDSVLALAGIFQSAALVQQLSRTGELPSPYFDASIKSVFSLDPTDVADVYGDINHLALGIDALYKIIAKNDTARYADAIRYSIGILHIEKTLRRDSDLLSVIRSRIETVESQRVHFDGLTHTSIIAKLADIYVDTIGSLRYRIQVNGDPQQLQQDEVASKVRAILLSGVRSAILWRQLGGSRLQLLFQRRRLVSTLESFRSNIQLESDDT